MPKTPVVMKYRPLAGLVFHETPSVRSFYPEGLRVAEEMDERGPEYPSKLIVYRGEYARSFALGRVFRYNRDWPAIVAVILHPLDKWKGTHMTIYRGGEVIGGGLGEGLLRVEVLEPKRPIRGAENLPYLHFLPVVPKWTMHHRWYYARAREVKIEAGRLVGIARKCSGSGYNCTDVLLVLGREPVVRIEYIERNGHKVSHYVVNFQLSPSGVRHSVEILESWA